MCISTIPDQVILLRYSSHCWYGSNTINVTWHTLTSDYVVSLSKLFLTFAGNFAIKSDSNYNEFYNALKSPSLTPILTVSNHRSLLDDPLVLSSLIPWYMNIQPKYLRWALCAQEYCFQYSAFFSSIFGVGHTLPIWRGAGIDQEALFWYARQSVSNGCGGGGSKRWLHIFPEGGVYQYPSEEISSRRPPERAAEIGHLKWGIGKVIAHSPSYKSIFSRGSDGEGRGGPEVYPFHMSGTEALTPMDIVSRKVHSYVPRGGHEIQVVFGPKINFDDLMEEHERATGKRIRKYYCCDAPHTHADGGDGIAHMDVQADDMVSLSTWVSSREEIELYKKITNRIEREMEKLNQSRQSND